MDSTALVSVRLIVEQTSSEKAHSQSISQSDPKLFN